MYITIATVTLPYNDSDQNNHDINLDNSGEYMIGDKSVLDYNKQMFLVMVIILNPSRQPIVINIQATIQIPSSLTNK